MQSDASCHSDLFANDVKPAVARKWSRDRERTGTEAKETRRSNFPKGHWRTGYREDRRNHVHHPAIAPERTLSTSRCPRPAARIGDCKHSTIVGKPGDGTRIEA